MIKQTFKKRLSGHHHGRSTVSHGSNIYDKHDKDHNKTYNTVLSPIYENVAYLNLEHGISGERCRYCKERDSSLPFQAYLERRQHKAAKRRHSDHVHVPKIRLSCGHIGRKGDTHCETEPGESPFRRRVETNLNRHCEAHAHTRVDRHRKHASHSLTRCSDVVRADVHKPRDQALENSTNENYIPLRDLRFDNTEKQLEDSTSVIAEYDALPGKSQFNEKIPLKYTTSDPTCNRLKTDAKARDYVGYNVIENFLKDSSFDAELNEKSKKIRSNSEPGTSSGMAERLKNSNSFFIDAFDDKSKSLETLNINNGTEDSQMKVSDKESPGTPKRRPLDYKPIEAYKEEVGVSNVKSSNVHQDDQVPSTSKISQSSIYQGHALDPALLMAPSTPIGNQALPFEFGQNNRRVKLTPLEQRRRRPCCPAEKKIEKRCFLLFFIVLVLAVAAFVVFNLFGWFDGDFKDNVADLFINKNTPTAGVQPNVTHTNSTGNT